MTLTRRGVLGAVVIAALLGQSCRRISVCEDEACDEDERALAQGGDAGHVGDGGIGAVAGGDGGGGAAPAREHAGAAGDAGSSSEIPAGLVCEAGLADCDGSTLTGCETVVGWNQSQCGECGVACEGACYGGSCVETILIDRDVVPRDVVLTRTHAFASLYGTDLTFAKIDRDTGVSETLLTLPIQHSSSDSTLVLGADLVYLFHAESAEIWSVPLEGGQPEREDVMGPSSIAASSQGVYYVSFTEDEETWETEYQLWFRPKGDKAWQSLYRGGAGRLIASGLNRVAFITKGDEATEFYSLNGATLELYGSGPEVLEARVTDGGTIAVLASGDDGLELWWLGSTGLIDHYPVDGATYNEHRYMHMSGSAVVLYFEEEGGAFAQFFGVEGAGSARIGLPVVSSVALVDGFDIWFGVWDNWAARRFLRSTYYSFR
jgi:hypothetical protein